MEYSEDLNFYRVLQERGQRSPLDELPPLNFTSSWYLDVFRIFNSGRQELNQIPLQDIFSYIDHFDIIGSKEEFVEIIQAMDEVFIKFYKQNIESKSKVTKAKELKHGRPNPS